MGICTSRGKRIQSFTEKEKAHLKETFLYLANKHKETEGKELVCQQAFEELFSDNRAFGIKLFKFYLSDCSSKKFIDLEGFLSISEILIKDAATINLQKYKNFDKIEVMAMIYLQKFELVPDDLKNIEITYFQANEFLRDTLKLITYTQQMNIKQFKGIETEPIKALVDQFYLIKEKLHNWENFLEFTKNILINLNIQLKIYFSFKLYTRVFNFELPKLMQISNIINNDHLILSYFSNTQMMETKSLQLLYQTNVKDYDQQSLYDAICKIVPDAQSKLILISYELPPSEFEFNVDFRGYIFKQHKSVGALAIIFNKTNGVYVQDIEANIYTLYPYYRQLNNPILNNKVRYLQEGYGFGGNLADDKYIIWLDQDINNSKISYNNNYLLKNSQNFNNHSYRNLKVLNIEVWSLEKNKQLNQRGTITERIFSMQDNILDELERRSAYANSTNLEDEEKAKKSGKYNSNNRNTENIHQNGKLDKSKSVLDQRVDLLLSKYENKGGEPYEANKQKYSTIRIIENDKPIQNQDIQFQEKPKKFGHSVTVNVGNNDKELRYSHQPGTVINSSIPQKQLHVQLLSFTLFNENIDGQELIVQCRVGAVNQKSKVYICNDRTYQMNDEFLFNRSYEQIIVFELLDKNQIIAAGILALDNIVDGTRKQIKVQLFSQKNYLVIGEIQFDISQNFSNKTGLTQSYIERQTYTISN